MKWSYQNITIKQIQGLYYHTWSWWISTTVNLQEIILETRWWQKFCQRILVKITHDSFTGKKLDTILFRNDWLLFVERKKGTQFTLLMSSCLRGSWSFTSKNWGTCITWNSLWTRIQTHDSPGEVGYWVYMYLYCVSVWCTWVSVKYIRIR